MARLSLNETAGEEEKGETGIEIEDKEQTADFQRYATNVQDILDVNFRLALCGWCEVQEQQSVKSRLFEGVSIMNRTFAPRKDHIVRMCNEQCADSLSHGLFGMVSHVTQLSYLSEKQIYRLWRGYKHDTRMLLLRNIYLDHNTFQIEPAYLYFINAYHTTYIPITYKAKGGATMDAFTQQVMSVFQQMVRTGQPIQLPKETLGDKVGNILRLKK